MVDALFVDARGIYPRLLGAARCWDAARDARAYAGDGPVVAHPPCGRWCGMARLNEKRYGLRVGEDGGCFASALATVRRVGGVLEHPAGSLAWPTFGLARPARGMWTESGTGEWVAEVSQSAYGHKARKRTWLLYVGPRPGDMLWDSPPGTHQVGWFDRAKPTLGKREASATPTTFAEALIALASRSRD